MANEKTVAQAMRCLAATLVALAILLSGCAPDQQVSSTDDDIAAIEAVVDGLTDAYAARDWESFAGFFTDDGVWMPPGSPTLRGEDAWWSLAQQWWDSSKVIDIGVTIEEIVVTGDWAIERHTEFQVMTIADAAEPVSVYFKGIWILQRQEDGTWKVARYIWNEGAPPVAD